MAEIGLRGLTKRFGDHMALHEVDLQVPDGAFVALVGPSGCGKSTLLRLIAGLEDASAGDVLIGGERVTALPPQERGVAMVFQSYALYPHMTVRDNMAFGLRHGRKLSPQTIAARVNDAADRLAIGSLLDRLPRMLSGGQRQRVAIGRAIVRQPRVFLFDEPLSNLDAALRVQMRMELARLHRELGATMVYVTHDQTEAMTLASQVVVLRDGGVQQVGAPLTLYHRPANRFVAGFIGSPQMNFIPAQVGGVTGDVVQVSLPGGVVLSMAVDAPTLRTGVALTLGIRPEHVMVDAAMADGALAATVRWVEQLGDSHVLHACLIDGTAVAVRGAGGARVAEGQGLGLRLCAGSAHLFDAAGLTIARAG